MSKVWFITGASRGIGAEIVKVALATGNKVVATGRNTETITNTFGNSENFLALRLDVTKEEDAAKAVQAAVDRFGRIDVLVNNAGYALFGAVEELSDEEVKKQFDTNVFGLLNVTRAVLPVMRKQRFGHIFNISSTSGLVGFAASSAYCATKFAVEGISESLYHEVQPLGIKVTIIEPGAFRSGFLSTESSVSSIMNIDDYKGTAGIVREYIRQLNNAQPGNPVKLAAALLTLADETHPPLRFVAGTDAVALMDTLYESRMKEYQQWRSLSASLGYDS
ncbi:oxidoreductase [Xanthocytophaga agilis]|uniref:Oxidoreductase n=1 Tax=Xanthocytophaga agilis TaxID=3048010 RepID=A0AAE3RAT8_9BACT|nr:oxidoreductase [Xanthocytophaga agilis]MDJ1506856.1 oxidoreductase [Xanthocytophaga agilis]